MGREIRMVPKGWEHPQNDRCRHWGGRDCHKEHCSPDDFHYGKCFKPLFGISYEDAANEWLKSCIEYENSKHIIMTKGKNDFEKIEKFYWDYDGMPPEKDFYVVYKKEDCVCYQIYETVSEGTPVSPVFDNLTDVEEWLIKKGHSRESAKAFCKLAWAPSMIVVGGMFKHNIDSFND